MKNKTNKIYDIQRDLNIAIISKTFSFKEIKKALCQTSKNSKRVRDLPSDLLVYYVITSALFMNLNLKEVLRCLLEGLRSIPLYSTLKISAKSAISQAKQRLGYEPLKQLYENTVKPIASSKTKGAWYKTWRLVSFDGSCVNIPDEKVNKKFFGNPITNIKDKYIYPQIRFVCLAETGTHVLFAANLGGYNEGEISLAKDIMGKLQPGMLCLTDRGLCNYPLWKLAREAGSDLLWRSKVSLSLPIEQALPDGSYLSTLCPKSRTEIPNEPFKVRVILYKIKGTGDDEMIYQLITSILDYNSAPAEELAILYHERWEIENCFDEFKYHLLNGRDCLRSKTPGLVKQEFYGLLLAHFAIRKLMHEAALVSNKDPDKLSFTHSLNVTKRKIIICSVFSPCEK